MAVEAKEGIRFDVKAGSDKVDVLRCHGKSHVVCTPTSAHTMLLLTAIRILTLRRSAMAIQGRISMKRNFDDNTRSAIVELASVEEHWSAASSHIEVEKSSGPMGCDQEA